LSISFRLVIPTQFLQAVFAHAQTEFPNECCGLLGGKIDAAGTAVVERHYPLVNEAASPVRYGCEGKSLFDAHKDMRNNKLEILAVYHSHPTSDPIPSKTDLAVNLYGASVMHLIVSLKQGAPAMRGWWLQEANYQDGAWQEQAFR
jgi:proteasome lid subunit RPN8/RPN11